MSLRLPSTSTTEVTTKAWLARVWCWSARRAARSGFRRAPAGVMCPAARVRTPASEGLSCGHCSMNRECWTANPTWVIQRLDYCEGFFRISIVLKFQLERLMIVVSVFRSYGRLWKFSYHIFYLVPQLKYNKPVDYAKTILNTLCCVHRDGYMNNWGKFQTFAHITRGNCLKKCLPII